MFDIGFQELLLIMVIALLVFGPKKLPELGRAIGRATREFRRASDEFRSTIETNLMGEEQRPPAEVYSPPQTVAATTEALPDSTLHPEGIHDEPPASNAPSVASEPSEPFLAQRASRLFHGRECSWSRRIPETER